MIRRAIVPVAVLSARARKKLGRAKSVKLKLALTTVDPAGNKRSVSRSLTLKR